MYLNYLFILVCIFIIVKGQQLECCNRCRQPSPSSRWYICEDRTEMQLGCNFGCRNCRCNPTRYPACQCLDQLYRCPPSCGDFD